jgi:hypothetical protein
MIIQIAVGIALAPVVFALGLLLLRGAACLASELPYIWEDHPNVSIVLACGALALMLSVIR